MKYLISENEDEILPNLLGLKTAEDIGNAEFEGFLEAEIILTEALTSRTKFNIDYIKKIHRLSLKHLYSFAGKYRDVNLSKGGFLFPAAKFLPETMLGLEEQVLKNIPNRYLNKEALIRDVAVVHAELLFIHPFREGNGRTARILANLMLRKQKHPPLKFELIKTKKEFEEYIKAVQLAADKNYKPMIKLIASIFPG